MVALQEEGWEEALVASVDLVRAVDAVVDLEGVVDLVEEAEGCSCERKTGRK